MNLLYKSEKFLGDEIKRTDMPYGSVAFWHLGQSGIIIKGQAKDGVIAIDPYLTSSIEEKDPMSEFRRAFPPPIKPAELEGVSGALVTHFHDDHLDVATLSGLVASNNDAIIAVPASHLFLLEGHLKPKSVQPVNSTESFQIKGFTITPILAAHTEYDTDKQGNPYYFGYVIDVNGIKLFHSGDTVMTDDLIKATRKAQPDIAFLPINGGDYARTKRGIIGNMSFREAADFAAEIHVDLIVPLHYDMFPTNRDNPSYFVDYLFRHYPAQKFHMMVPGERFIYYK